MRNRGVQPIRLATWALGALAAGLLAAAPAQAQTKELRFGHLHSVESPIHKGVSKAAEEFAKTSGGVTRSTSSRRASSARPARWSPR